MKYLSIVILVAASSAAADVAGKWDVVAVGANGREYKLVMDLSQKEGKWGGNLAGPQGDIQLEEVRFDGKELAYAFSLSQGHFKIKLSLEGESLKGNFTTPDGSLGTMTATRPASAPEITGIWNVSATLADGSQHTLKLNLKKEEGALKGHFILPEGQTIPVTDLKLEGNELSFKTSSDNSAFQVKLVVAGASMKGGYTAGNGSKGTVEATR